MNDFQEHRFSEKIMSTLFNTVSSKKIAFLGWAFKKDTNDSRESAAIYIADELLQDRAEIYVYDPKVNKEQIYADLEYLQSHRVGVFAEQGSFLTNEEIRNLVTVHKEPYSALKDAHAIAVLTEWDEFRTYDWQKIYNKMLKPAFVFDGRDILDRVSLKKIGFELYTIGK